jgi:transposase
MTTSDPISIGVGFDTARYGHHVSFLRPDLQPAAKPFHFTESAAGYAQLRQALEQIQKKYGSVHFHIRIDAAGQYAVNLERFLRDLPCEKTLSVGQPKQNRDYCQVHFPKRKADPVESLACARFALVEHPASTPETPAAFAQLREIAGALESQAKHTTRLVNQLHNRLARVFPELATVVPSVRAAWVLRLLARYPTPAKIAGAQLSSLVSIPHLGQDKAATLQAAARQTVAGFHGPVIEELIRQSVRSIQHRQKTTRALQRALEQAFNALPPGPHQQIETITGIGKLTAAALVAKMVSIDRFATPGSVVNYFGLFPEEYTSGTDKFGRPIPPGTMRLSPKGNDLVRRCLWNAAKTAIVHNPVIRDLYARQRARGKRGDVVLGHCMRKLVHLVVAVWKTGKPFTPPETDTHDASSTPAAETERAQGRKGQRPGRQAVTQAGTTIPQPAPVNNSASVASAAPGSAHRIDFARLRQQITREQVLGELQWWDRLTGRGAQRRGPCPIHEPSAGQGRCFSVHLGKKVFQCFEASCGAKGNALDLWAKSRGLTIHQAAHELAQRLGITTG